MLSVGLVFVLFITGAWRKSVTTTIYVLSLSIGLQCFLCNNEQLAIAVVTFGAIIALVRAMFHHSDDTLMRE